MLLSKYGVCNSKKSRFIKKQEASGLLNSLGIKAALSLIPLVGPHLLAGDKFLPEMRLRRPGFTNSVYGPFTKNKEGKQKLKKQEIHDIFINKN